MKILIAGGSSFIGKNLLLNLNNKKDQVTAIYNNDTNFLNFLENNNLANINPIKCDLLDLNSINTQLKKKLEIDICIFLVANTDVPFSMKNPLSDLNINSVTLLNLFNRIKCKRLIFFSSGAVYIGNKGLVSPKTVLNPDIPYSISKLASENYVKYLKRIHIINEYIILRFYGAYGPYELTRKIFRKLIDNFYYDQKNEFTIYGNGKNLIDAMYIDDTILGIQKVIESNISDVTLDFCVGKSLTIENLVKQVAKIFNFPNPKLTKEGQSHEYIEFRSSSKQMKDLFSFEPKISLSTGIKKYCEFIDKMNK
jgi:nucleoside-diphosphate-sugar epimerase